MPLDLADACESRGPVLPVSIAGVLRYIESFKALAFPLRYVFIGGSGNLWAYSSCPKNIPSQAVNWFGSLLLHVTRNMTRQ